jgi:dTDP-4-dehydrorhamnose 3,5-epimerase-like enzyme
MWNDPDVGIEWPEQIGPFQLSAKDQDGTPLREIEGFA